VASAEAAATVTLTAPATGRGTTGQQGHTVGVVVGGTPSRVVSVTPVAGSRLAHTGTEVGGRARLAIALILAGVLLVAAAWKRKPRAALRRS